MVVGKLNKLSGFWNLVMEGGESTTEFLEDYCPTELGAGSNPGDSKPNADKYFRRMKDVPQETDHIYPDCMHGNPKPVAQRMPDCRYTTTCSRTTRSHAAAG